MKGKKDLPVPAEEDIEYVEAEPVDRVQVLLGDAAQLMREFDRFAARLRGRAVREGQEEQEGQE